MTIDLGEGPGGQLSPFLGKKKMQKEEKPAPLVQGLDPLLVTAMFFTSCNFSLRRRVSGCRGG